LRFRQPIDEESKPLAKEKVAECETKTDGFKKAAISEDIETAFPTFLLFHYSLYNYFIGSRLQLAMGNKTQSSVAPPQQT